jgi:hypothetical protein
LESGAAKLATAVVETDDALTALKALGKFDVVREDPHGGNTHNFDRWRGRLSMVVGNAPDASIGPA